MKIRHHSVMGLVLAASLAVTAAADEGMWTFDNPPVKQLKDKYNFTPAEQWLDHIRLSSVRFNDGGSGSFVSPNGLVITNHHVALGQLQKISNAQRDYVKDGFYAKTQAEELKAPDLELNVLVSMENVTSRVQGAVKPGMTEKQALDARKAEQAKIQKESLDKTGLRSGRPYISYSDRASTPRLDRARRRRSEGLSCRDFLFESLPAPPFAHRELASPSFPA